MEVRPEHLENLYLSLMYAIYLIYIKLKIHYMLTLIMKFYEKYTFQIETSWEEWDGSTFSQFSIMSDLIEKASAVNLLQSVPTSELYKENPASYR